MVHPPPASICTLVLIADFRLPGYIAECPSVLVHTGPRYVLLLLQQRLFMFTGCEALFSTNSLATQLVSDPHVMGVSPHVINLAAMTPFTNAMPSSSSSYSSEAGVGVPEYGANFSGTSCIRSNELAVDIPWKGLLPGPF